MSEKATKSTVFTRKLASLISESGRTQSEIAELADVSAAQLSEYKSGAMPGPIALHSLCRVLNVPADWLIDGTQESLKPPASRAELLTDQELNDEYDRRYMEKTARLEGLLNAAEAIDWEPLGVFLADPASDHHHEALFLFLTDPAESPIHDSLLPVANRLRVACVLSSVTSAPVDLFDSAIRGKRLLGLPPSVMSRATGSPMSEIYRNRINAILDKITRHEGAGPRLLDFLRDHEGPNANKMLDVLEDSIAPFMDDASRELATTVLEHKLATLDRERAKRDIRRALVIGEPCDLDKIRAMQTAAEKRCVGAMRHLAKLGDGVSR